MRYLIADDEIKEREVSRRQKTADQLIEQFDPMDDPFDRRILYEMTKRRVEVEDYNDDTSQEEDVIFNESGELVINESIRNRLQFFNDILGTNRHRARSVAN